MRASLIMTVYNAEKYLPRILKNVFCQEFKDFELVAVNDGSTDDSLSILTKYSQTEPRLNIIDQPNSGIGRARAKGLSSATGDYIGFVDCDDELSPKLLLENFKLLNTFEADVVLFGYTRYYPESRKETFELPSDKVEYFKTNEAFGKSFLGINRNSDLGFAWNKLIKRSFLLEHNISFSSAKTDDDAIFVYQLLKVASRIIVNPQSYYRYMMRKSSLSHHILDLDSLENDILQRQNMAIAMFRKWNEPYNYVIGHNDVRLLDVGFRKIFQGKKLSFKNIYSAHQYLKQSSTNTLMKKLVGHFGVLTKKDKLYVLASKFRLFAIVYAYNNK